MVHTSPRSFNYRSGAAVLLLSLLAASAGYSYYLVENARAEYQASSVEPATPEATPEKDEAAKKEA